MQSQSNTAKKARLQRKVQKTSDPCIPQIWKIFLDAAEPLRN